MFDTRGCAPGEQTGMKLVAQRKNIAGNGLNGKPVKPSVKTKN